MYAFSNMGFCLSWLSLSLPCRATTRLWNSCCWSLGPFPMQHVQGCVRPDWTIVPCRLKFTWNTTKFELKKMLLLFLHLFQALPQIFINRLGVRSAPIQTLFRSILPIPLCGKYLSRKRKNTLSRARRQCVIHLNPFTCQIWHKARHQMLHCLLMFLWFNSEWASVRPVLTPCCVTLSSCAGLLQCVHCQKRGVRKWDPSVRPQWNSCRPL